ncbi:MAG TPA: hypothetical protein VGL71_11625 [Urbifossiella sp.]
MRSLVAAFGVALLTAITGTAADKGATVEWAGLKSTTPAGWKEETPSSKFRQGQFKIPKVEGDKEDAELAIFFSPGGGGIDANLKRQVAAFQPAEGKEKVGDKQEKIKIGGHDAVYQEVTGTFIKKAFPMAQTGTPMPGYKQIYVIFETKDGAVASLWLRGPEKTVDKHKKEFDEWVKGFK